MKVEIAKYAGFCMGVDLALKKLDNAIINEVNNVVTIGPIIHNPQVLKEYEEKNVKILENIDEVQPDTHVIIRAHGIPQNEEKILEQRCSKVIDATCPKVKAAQLALSKASKKALDEHTQAEDCLLLLYGEEEHPEVKGLVSYSHIPYIVFADETVFDAISFDKKIIILASQTTQDKNLFLQFHEKLIKKQILKLEVLDTICDATKQRQEAVRELTHKVDAMIVVGGKSSGNTRRLAEISNSYSLPTYHIETVDELKKNVLNPDFTYGLTAGASTPRKYIDDVKNYLENL